MTGGGGDRQGRRVTSKTMTTVALDFGCVTIDQEPQDVPVGRRSRTASASCGATSPGALGALVIMDVQRMDELLPRRRLLREDRLALIVGIDASTAYFRTTSTTSVAFR